MREKKFKMVCLDASTLADNSLKEIRKYGELISYPTSTKEEALERVADCQVLIVNKAKVDAQLMDRARELKLICVAATGMNNIELEEAKKRSITVRNVAGYSTDSVVQTTFTHILSLVGNARYFDNYVKSGQYSASKLFTEPTHPAMELAGKTMGIIGLGTIGKKVASIASAFGMKVVYYSTSLTCHCKDYPCLSLKELLSISDIVSIHSPLNERTAGLIGSNELALMKPSAYIINTGRGGIIDEKALAEAIDEGIIAGAGLDVFETEPLPSDNPLIDVKHPERLSLTPHIAWASAESQKRLVEGIAYNISLGLE